MWLHLTMMALKPFPKAEDAAQLAECLLRMQEALGLFFKQPTAQHNPVWCNGTSLESQHLGGVGRRLLAFSEINGMISRAIPMLETLFGTCLYKDILWHSTIDGQDSPLQRLCQWLIIFITFDVGSNSLLLQTRPSDPQSNKTLFYNLKLKWEDTKNIYTHLCTR